jgi:hypothetical protein
MKKLLVFTLFFLLNVNCLAQSIVINELITSNAAVITDEDGSYEDWIELYNPSSNVINLAGYGLSDLPTNPYLWVFPEYWIQPGAHLLIWCSDKNRTDINFPLHTNFKISSAGENIILTDPSGATVDIYSPIVIPQNYTYGRQTDGSSTFVIFPQPTPGQSNNTTQGFTELLDPPSFSVNGGFFSENFNLVLSHPDPLVTIIYTTDGSDPDINNLNGTTYPYKNQYPIGLSQLPIDNFATNSFQSSQYAAPITIADRTNQPNDISMISSTFDSDPSYYIPDYSLFKGTVVRAKAYKTGAMPSKISSNSYFVSPEGSQRFSIPVVSISVDENKFFDYNDGIYVAGADFDDWRVANPSTTALYNADSNFDRSGDASERVGHFSYFVNGSEVLNQQVGIRINGGGSRAFQNKSMRLYARAELGASSFDYPVFPNENFTSYKRLILRNSGNDFFNTYYKDAFTHELIEKTGLDNQAYQPSVVFLNGEYWGMLNLRERLDRHYFERKYGIEELDIEIISDGYQVDEGSGDHFQAMFNYLENNSLSSLSNYDYIKTQMDVDNFRDYFITNIFIQNTDWPGWNTLFWRKKGTFNPAAPYGTDGRWRTAVKDTDAGFSLMLDINDHNTLAFATATGGTEWPNPEWSTLILRRLLENNDFKLNFINRFADMMNTFFLPERVIGLSNQFASVIEPEIEEQIQRWSAPSSMSWWQQSQNVIETFATVRPDIQREHIRNKFGISGNLNVTLNVNDTEQGFVKVNTIEINSGTPGVPEIAYPWTGIYFQNIPITLKAIALPGFVFSHWSGASTSTESEITITPLSDISIVANFIPDNNNEVAVPIYFWMFDTNVANDTPLTTLNSTFEVPTEGSMEFQSCLTGYPFDSTSPFWRKASMERRNSPTNINYIPEANNNIPFATSNMRGIQIKQPFQSGTQENTLIFNLSTSNFKDIKFAFAAINELAADAIVVDYSVVGGTPIWIADGLAQTSYALSAAFQLFQIDFSSIESVENNPNFKVRLRFTGSNMTEDLGKRVTFNNFSTTGVPISLGVENNSKLEFKIFPNPVSNTLNIVHQYDSLSYKLFSIDGKMIQEGSVMNSEIHFNQLQSGIYLLQLTTNGNAAITKLVKQ